MPNSVRTSRLDVLRPGQPRCTEGLVCTPLVVLLSFYTKIVAESLASLGAASTDTSDCPCAALFDDAVRVGHLASQTETANSYHRHPPFTEVPSTMPTITACGSTEVNAETYPSKSRMLKRASSRFPSEPRRFITSRITTAGDSAGRVTGGTT